MIKYINPNILAKSEFFVLEPIISLGEKLKSVESKGIILNGDRGSGRSSVLTALATFSKPNDFLIKVDLKNKKSFAKEPNKIFDFTFFCHYYEVNFCNELLIYIQNKLPYIYELDFMDIALLLHNQTRDLNDIILEPYENLPITRYYQTGEIASEIVRRLKKRLKNPNITLLIDDFDLINSGSLTSQIILKGYFALFDKVIITSNDQSLEADYLTKRGYKFMQVDYNTNPEVVNKIIRGRVSVHNSSLKSPNEYFPLAGITPKVVEILLKKTEGNLTNMIVITSQVIREANTNNINSCFEDLFEKFGDEILSKRKELKRFDIKSKLVI